MTKFKDVLKSYVTAEGVELPVARATFEETVGVCEEELLVEILPSGEVRICVTNAVENDRECASITLGPQKRELLIAVLQRAPILTGGDK